MCLLSAAVQIMQNQLLPLNLSSKQISGSAWYVCMSTRHVKSASIATLNHKNHAQNRSFARSTRDRPNLLNQREEPRSRKLISCLLCRMNLALALQSHPSWSQAFCPTLSTWRWKSNTCKDLLADIGQDWQKTEASLMEQGPEFLTDRSR